MKLQLNEIYKRLDIIYKNEYYRRIFKNRVSFTPNSNQQIPTFFSEIFLKQENYSIDLLKEKNKSFCHYLYSVLNIDWYIIEIYLQKDEKFADLSIQSEKIVEIDCTILEGNRFLWTFEDCFNRVKSKFCHQMPSKPPLCKPHAYNFLLHSSFVAVFYP